MQQGGDFLRRLAALDLIAGGSIWGFLHIPSLL
jgi:hypothetical protein